MVTVGPLLLHFEWKMNPPQPSLVARQQRDQEDLMGRNSFSWKR